MAMRGGAFDRTAPPPTGSCWQSALPVFFFGICHTSGIHCNDQCFCVC